MNASASKVNLSVVEGSRAHDSGPHALALEDYERRLARAREVIARLESGLNEVIIGQEHIVVDVVTALLSGGHVLLEGAPGLGKTHLVRTLSSLIGGRFARIQFTPDLMPSDVLGTLLVVEGPNGKDLSYRPGPVFTNLLLADEINRATPKTQSALLEAMAERTVSVDGEPRPLPRPFFVLATENPIEMEGVFPLPEAQLDRFLMKLVLKMPDLSALARIGARPEEPEPPTAVTTPEELRELQGVARTIAVAPHVSTYAARLTLATHEPAEVRYGAGPRAAQALMACARVRALEDGRTAVGIDDVRDVAGAVLRHRIVLGFEADAQGLDGDTFVERAIASTPVEG